MTIKDLITQLQEYNPMEEIRVGIVINGDDYIQIPIESIDIEESCWDEDIKTYLDKDGNEEWEARNIIVINIGYI